MVPQVEKLRQAMKEGDATVRAAEQRKLEVEAEIRLLEPDVEAAQVPRPSPSEFRRLSQYFGVPL